MSKKILFHEDARTALKEGIDTAVNAAKVTIGPRGRNVALDKSYGGPTITNDGVSIVKEISLADTFQNMGVAIVKEVANKTNDAAGDGTTTASVLLQAVVTEGMKGMEAGMGVIGIKKGIESASQDVVNELQNMAKKIANSEEIKQVATISAESEELGAIIAETIEKVGQDGVVTVEESQGLEMTSEVVEGMQFDKGYISPYMVTDSERMEAVYENVPVLLVDGKISAIKEVLPILEQLAQTGKKDLVIIAEDVDGEALATFVVNKLRGALNVLAVKAPGFGDRRKAMLEDLAVVTGADVVSGDKGMKLEEANMNVLGSAKKIIVTKDTTTIIDGAGSAADIKVRVDQLKAQAEASSSSFDKEKLEERVAKLSGGVAVIKVGAATETAMKYLKLKIEDAVNATKAAIEQGIVAGGGTALVKAAAAVRATMSTQTKEEQRGYEIVLNACQAPLSQILQNSGKSDKEIAGILEKVQGSDSAAGYDSLRDEYVDDMLSAGIIDPVKVTHNALLNAASAAATFLTTEVAVADDPDAKEESHGHGHMHGGGMPGGMGF